MAFIYHLTSRSEATVAAVEREYRHESLETEGFIHCSFASQLARSANKHHAGSSDLVVFQIDRDQVPADVVDENTSGGTELYPHIYGPLPMDAVVAIHDLPCNDDGTFEVPASIPEA